VNGRSTPRISTRLARLATAALAVAAFVGCSGSQLESIEGQLSDLQRQTLQLQREASSKDEIAALQDRTRDQTQSLLKAQADIQVELQSLSALIEQLEAKLEDTNYRLAQLSQQIAATNQELKSFRSVPEMGNGGRPLPGGLGSGAAADPETLYQTAYNDYLRGNYDLAILGFRQYLESFPDTDLADNATYWIGENYYRQRKFTEAVREFDNLLTRYPNSDKQASALLRKGYAYLETGEQAKGVVQLQHVIRRFPQSDEANLARQQLTSLGIDPQQVGS
jgi:tol-pal system protein YbgF